MNKRHVATGSILIASIGVAVAAWLIAIRVLGNREAHNGTTGQTQQQPYDNHSTVLDPEGRPAIKMIALDDSGELYPSAVIHGETVFGEAVLNGGAEVMHWCGEIQLKLTSGTLSINDTKDIELAFLNSPNPAGDPNEKRLDLIRKVSLYGALGVQQDLVKSPLAPDVQNAIDSVLADLVLSVEPWLRENLIYIAVVRKVHERNPAILDRFEILANDPTSIPTARYARAVLDNIRTGTTARENLDP